MSELFTELEELIILSRDNVQLTFPDAFQSGQRLRTLQLTRIAIPTLPQLLSPSTGIVDLQLHEIPNVRYFPPEVFANALSEMTQLETLSLHFISFPPRRRYLSLPPPSEEFVVLPTLTCLKYRGTRKYLGNFVTRIDAPRLGDIEMQTSLSRADIQTSARAICLSNPGTRLDLQISCEQLDWQLSSITQIRIRFSSFLSRVENLGIVMAQRSTVQDDMDKEQWAELIRAFGDIKEFRVVSNLQRTSCVLCVQSRGANYCMFPSLRTLGLPELMQTHGPLWEAAQSFFTSRRLSDCPVELCVTNILAEPSSADPGHGVDTWTSVSMDLMQLRLMREVTRAHAQAGGWAGSHLVIGEDG
ncbi:hypothetical protein EDB83DRAFT_2673352 [Lactarius deliciosus]|nr:hypothetical protein EDB83DRAFT_2673352 [Lactarius deliciosus]